MRDGMALGIKYDDFEIVESATVEFAGNFLDWMIVFHSMYCYIFDNR